MTKHISKQALRRHIPRSLLSRYRLGAERASFRNEAEQIGRGDAGSEACLLIGTPLHANLGDHLISHATRHFFNAVGMHRPIVEVPLEAYRAYGSIIRPGVCPNSTIFVNGGGWMGDMYPDDEATIEHIVNSFPDNEIIILPQTIYFSDPYSQDSHRIISSSKKVFTSHPNLTLCLREGTSFELAQKLYPSLRMLLLPDMAFAYDTVAPKNSADSSGVVGICLRNDIEIARDSVLAQQTLKALQPFTDQFVELSTLTEGSVNSHLSEAIVYNAIEAFAQCDIVVTDRLHGMLFAYLANTPCIAFDNKTKKVSSVYSTWLADCEKVTLVKSEEDVDGIPSFLRLSSKATSNHLSGEPFAPLKEKILHGIN